MPHSPGFVLHLGTAVAVSVGDGCSVALPLVPICAPGCTSHPTPLQPFHTTAGGPVPWSHFSHLSSTAPGADDTEDHFQEATATTTTLGPTRPKEGKYWGVTWGHSATPWGHSATPWGCSMPAQGGKTNGSGRGTRSGSAWSSPQDGEKMMTTLLSHSLSWCPQGWFRQR